MTTSVVNGEIVASIRRTCEALFDVGDDGRMAPVELRILGAGGKPNATHYGYFDDVSRLVAAAEGYDRGRASGVYVTLNDLHPDVIHRRPNRVDYGKDATKAADVIRRRWLLVDIDSERLSGISATDAELGCAVALARHVVEWLETAPPAGMGWPRGLRAMSGNGVHLLWRIDLPADDDSRDLIRRVLQAAHERFKDHPGASVDQTTFDNPRIFRLWGTTARKGGDSPERPWRRSQMLATSADQPEVVTLEQIHAIAAAAPKPTSRASSNGRTHKCKDFDLRTWLTEHGIAFTEKPGDGFQERYILSACPFDSSHAGTSVFAGRGSRGGLVFKCSHDSCNGRHWKQFRDLLEPDRRRNGKAAGGAAPTDGAGGNRMDLARGLIEHRYTRDGHQIIASHNDDIYVHTGTHYVPCPAFKQDVLLYLDEVGASDGDKGPTPRMAGEVAACIAALTRVPADATPPCRIDGASFEATPLGCRNGILWLHLDGDTFDVEFTPHAPENFILSSRSYDYDADAKCPHWKAFLQETLEGDDERVRELQKVFGWALVDSGFQLIPVLCGVPRGGKGTVLRALGRVVGSDAVASVSFASLAARFGLQPLLGRQLVILTDAHLSRMTDGTAAMEILKKLSGGDRLDVERKFRDTVSNVELPSKIIVASNELPAFFDYSGAIASRFHVIPFNKSHLGTENRQLDRTLARESAGVLQWALEGIRSMLDDEGFAKVGAAADLVASYARLSNPIESFLTDATVPNPDGFVKTKDLFEAYCRWAYAHGHKTMSDAQFGVRVHAARPSITQTRPRADGTRVRAYGGISLRPKIMERADWWNDDES